MEEATQKRCAPAGAAARKMELLKALGILVAVVLLYLPALHSGFLWDDDAFLTQNPLIHSPSGLHDFWLSTKPPDYFPLVSSLLWFQWRLWGSEPMGYHAVTILLHAVGCVLLWRVLAALAIPGAWLAALVFAIHPVNVTSVAWITETKNTLPMVLSMASLLFFLRFDATRAAKWFALSLAAYVLALLGKTSVVPLPFVLLLLLWWRRGTLTRRDLLGIVPFLGCAVLLGAVTAWFQYNRSITSYAVRSDSPLSRLLIAGWGVWFYLSKAFFPVGLSFVYPKPHLPPASILAWLWIVLLAGIWSVFFAFRRGWGRPFFAALTCYVLMLLPVLGFLNIFFMRYTYVADYWQYFALPAAVTLAIGGGACLLAKRGKVAWRAGQLLALLLCLGLAALSLKRQEAFRNEEALWRDTIRKNPSAAIAYSNLGVTLARRGELRTAEECMRKAVQIEPGSFESVSNLGSLLFKTGRTSESLPLLRQAMEQKPDSAELHKNLAVAYLSLGEREKARQELEASLHLAPEAKDVKKALEELKTPSPAAETAGK